MFFAANMTISAHATVAATQHMVAIPFWLEMLAIVAASISGVLTAREHKLDLIGAVALAVVCGLGGGLLRDMTLQVGNVYILQQPMALPISIATAAIIYIFPAIVDKPERIIPFLDILSVGIYSATGADKALVYGFDPVVCIMMGFSRQSAAACCAMDLCVLYQVFSNARIYTPSHRLRALRAMLRSLSLHIPIIWLL